MSDRSRWLRRLALTGAAAALAMLPIFAGVTSAHAQRTVSFGEADPTTPVDPAAAAIASRIQANGPLPGYTAERAAIDRAAAAERARQARAPAGPAEGRGPRATAVPGINDPGQDADALNTSTPPDTTGAIGATRFIQLVNTRFGIYNRSNGNLIAEGTLNTLFAQPVNASSFDPQILWDNQTNRFYYVGDTIISATDNRLSFGFSTGPNPNNGTTSWCHYQITYGAEFPDYPKLGDSQHFIIIGVNTFSGNTYVGSDLIGVSKPPAGATCPLASSLVTGFAFDVRDGANTRIFTPVPANDIDTKPLGFYVARNLGLPSTRLYIGQVSRNAGTGAPVFGTPKNLAVASYTLPPSAVQAGASQLLDTLDARPTQAQMAQNPDRGNAYSLWTQHTIRHPTQARSVVRWYEINPFPAVPTVLRTGTVGTSGTSVFYFNGAISPDRRADGAVRQFGDSFVLNFSSSGPGFNPRISVISSFNGGAPTAATLVRTSPNANFDHSCPTAGSVCRWGDYAAATPDPKPPAGNRGAVWGTNQTAGPGPVTFTPTWDTFFFAHRP